MTSRLHLFCAALSMSVAVDAIGQECTSRTPVAKAPVIAATLASDSQSIAPIGGHRLVVKFTDDVLARADDHGSLLSLAEADMTDAKRIAGEYGALFTPLILLPQERLAGLQERARRRSGICQPDLAGLLAVKLPEADAARLEQLGDALQTLAVVEFAAIEVLGPPPPTDLPPDTSDMTGLQGYLGADPGLNAEHAWLWAGGTGAGIRVSDCEYAWSPDHEDLNEIDLHLEPGQTIHPDSFAWEFDEHGTSVVGEIVAMDNEYGCKGIAPHAEIHTYPEWTTEEGMRRVTAITHAITNSAEGDVVLLEMQAVGPGGDYGPAELEQPVWVATRTGVDAGVIVIAAAGNGNQDLDSPPYTSYMSWGDSGAILVGAGTSSPDHGKLWFSTHGNRVNVQGWGEFVTTLGYGDLDMVGGAQDQNQYYTAEFAGTSSASPMIAAAAAVLQGINEQVNGTRLSPEEMRELLVQSGRPQGGGGGNIGPFPDLYAAIHGYGACPCGDGDSDGHYAEECTEPLCLLRDDCDNTTSHVYPGHVEECGDGLDNDCDGAIDGADDECSGDDDTVGDDDASDDDTAMPDDDTHGPSTSLGDAEIGAGCSCRQGTRVRSPVLALMLLVALARRRRCPSRRAPPMTR